jgi:predicted N-formylglutamate amidohydrolase
MHALTDKRIRISIRHAMAQTVRIDEATHALVRELADADNLSLNDELALAVQARRKERFFAEFHAAYAEITDVERLEEATENAVWDSALGDGLDDE